MIDDPEIPSVGLLPRADGSATWRVWAPNAERVELVLGDGSTAQRLRMTAEPRGFYRVATPCAETGQRYAYALDDKAPLPDPCSRWQPDGILRPSAVWFPERFSWNEGGWRGIARDDLVFYELHVGTFTPEGTFEAVIGRIPELLDLGITAIELMPVCQFPGRNDWGYDGVHPFAPQNSYGGPAGLHRLVDAAHRMGMAVFLDVVYNHMGPEGNVFPAFGPYFQDKYHTDWGAAINFDGRGCDPVRAMVVENARSWIRDYHFDGLRLDATDQIYDRSPRHVLADIVEAVHREGDRLDRPVWVFGETDLNDAARYLDPPVHRGYGLDGQWNDDFHHAAHVVLTGERNGYYIDFQPPRDLGKVYSGIFANDGRFSPFRGRRHGAPAEGFAGNRFVAFVQNHDQVGNRMKGDRYAASLPGSALRLAAGVLLLAPRLPLLFMGEEYGETHPFAFFCDFESEDLREAVRKGRKTEFAAFAWEGEPPDATSPATRDAAVLSWRWDEPEARGLRALYRDLIALRRQLPALRDFRPARTRCWHADAVLEAKRGGKGTDMPELTILFNLSDTEQPLPPSAFGAIPTLRSEHPRYGGRATSADEAPARLWPHEFIIFRESGETG